MDMMNYQFYNRDPRDPLWKFCNLLDRLVRNDKRFIDCITNLVRDFVDFGPMYIDQFERRFYTLTESYRRLLFLYVVDSICKNVPLLRDAFAVRVKEIFVYAFRSSEPIVQQDLLRLLQAWEVQQLFPLAVCDEIRERMAPTPPHISSPTASPTHNGVFDLGPVGDWLSQNSSLTMDLALQATEDQYSSLFKSLLEQECSRSELEKLQSRLNTFESPDVVWKLIYELYDELPKQCLICGFRFALEAELSEHLDWHFKMRKKLVVTSPWLPVASSWVNPKLHMGLLEPSTPHESAQEQERWALCDPSQLTCPLCQEPFEIRPRNGGWYCKDAIEVMVEDRKQQLILHQSCLTAAAEPTTPSENFNAAYSDAFD